LLSLGVSGDGGLPLRLGLRDGHTNDSTEPPIAIEEGLALGLQGVLGIVADSKAYYCIRTLPRAAAHLLGTARVHHGGFSVLVRWPG